MRNRLASTHLVALVATLGTIVSSRVDAQTTAPSSGDTHAPLFTVSAGVGRISAAQQGLGSLPLPFLSIGVPIGDSLTVEVEGAQWSRSTETVHPFSSTNLRSVKANTVSANLVFRSGTPRIGAVVGIGLGTQHANLESTSKFFCYCQNPQVTSFRWREWDLPGQVIGGIDVNLTPNLSVFGTARWRIVGDDGDTMVFGGVRVAPLTRVVHAPSHEGSLASAKGQDVRVTTTNGTERKGKLLTLSGTSVLLREGTREVSILLEEVQKVEKSSHHARNWGWTAAVLGFLAGTLGDCGGQYEGDCMVPIPGAIFAGIAGGAAALLGAFANASGNRNVIYQAPAQSNPVMIAPMLAPGNIGVDMALRW